MNELTLEALLEAINSDDAETRTNAWQAAGGIGAPAVGPLAKIVDSGDLEVGRAAKRAIWKIVRTVGAPGAEGKEGVVAALIGLLGNEQSDAVRREVFWMLSEIGGNSAIEAIRDIPGILENTSLREDARACVERIPTEFAIQTLQEGLSDAPADYKINLAQSLRARGVEVPGLPCQKLTPVKQTAVKPVGR